MIFTLQHSCPVKHSSRTAATPTAVWSGSDVASGHLENKQEMVMMYLFPLGVSGNGPLRCTPMVCQTSLFTGMGCSSAVYLSNLLQNYINKNEFNKTKISGRYLFTLWHLSQVLQKFFTLSNIPNILSRVLSLPKCPLPTCNSLLWLPSRICTFCLSVTTCPHVHVWSVSEKLSQYRRLEHLADSWLCIHVPASLYLSH